LPQTQLPNWLHESARVASHVPHVWPFGPHAITVRTVWQTPLRQQPCGQFCALHVEQTPFVHVPLPQPLQAPPKRPHCVALCEANGTHTLPLQHPPAQVCALQMHWPAKQVEPVGQGAWAPHAHWPCALHESVVC
jgi:hypothetical protein